MVEEKKSNKREEPTSTWILRASSRSDLIGEMKLARQTIPASAKSLAISATRRMFSVRSFWEKERSLHSPWRTLSPSRPYAGIPS